MRDWPRTLSPASWKGVVFLVDEEQIAKSGRFVATHSFVRSDTHETEDLGRVPREYTVAAYFASNTADIDAQAFVELCSTRGPGTLVLPILGIVRARCTNCHVRTPKGELGRVEVALSFIEAGSADGSFAATPLGDRLCASALGGMPAAASTALSGMTDQVPGVSTPVTHDYEMGGAADLAAQSSALGGLTGAPVTLR